MYNSPSFSILYVEDEQAAREILCSILIRKYPKITLYVAENGDKGLEAFKEHLPEIVITDISMPQMDGIQLATEIKSLQPKTSVIATTAHSSVQSLDNSKKIGINHYIQKPIIYKELFAAIDKCASVLTPPPLILINQVPYPS